ncbi:MAG: hypothetical protein WAL88_05700 [Nitrosotalea sp.]
MALLSKVKDISQAITQKGTESEIDSKQIEIKFNTYDYGTVFRSSGIFYFKKGSNIKTTISMLNYWKIKRDLNVTIVASLRNMDGSLIKRDVLTFNDSTILNYSPEIPEDYFEGSVEIEALSTQHMVIPFAGIIAVYQTKYGISMVHTYGRTYSQHEIEENKVLAKAEESCYNSLVDETDESFAIFHNGSLPCPEQKLVVSMVNTKGQRKEKIIDLHKLNPYETVKIRLKDYFPDLFNFLDGEIGYSSYSFHLNKSAFPRMMTINQNHDGTDLQLTHSFFNFSKLSTGVLGVGKKAFMVVPLVQNAKQSVVIYPDYVEGKYAAKSLSGNTVYFDEKNPIVIPIQGNDSDLFTFEKIQGQIQNRFHTALRVSNSRIPSEACVGFNHEEVPPKHFFWGICACNDKIKSQIMLQQYKVFPDVDIIRTPVIIRLYTSISDKYLETTINPLEIRNGRYVNELFPEAEKFLGDGFGWFTLYSPATHAEAYSTLENEFGSITMEHTM